MILLHTIAAAEGADTAVYQYRDTQRLVNLVDSAAELVAAKGTDAFAELGAEDSPWLYGQYYVFVYAPDGTCLFHPVQKELVGKKMADFRDMHNKPVIEFITRIGTESRPDRGWVFYLWPDKTELLPRWKGAYVRRVVAPDKREYLVGSGAYNIKTERFFIEERVGLAADLLQAAGKEAAFEQFRNPGTPFVFLEAYIFVLDEQGRAMFDPAYPTIIGRNVSDFRDAVGKPVIGEVLEKLEHGQEAWVQYLWPRPGASLPSRRSS